MDKKIYNKNTAKFFIGKKVKSVELLKNHYYEAPVGTVFEITDKCGGFHLFTKLSCCGIRLFFSKVNPCKIELL